MSTIHSKRGPRATLARDNLPGPSRRRSWPRVALAFGLKRTLTGISFADAEKRLAGYRGILSTLSKEQLEAITKDDPWAGPLGSQARENPRAA